MSEVLEEWQAYLDARRSGVKQRWKPLLDERVAGFESLDPAARAVYIDALCAAHFDQGVAELPIRHPAIWPQVLTRLSQGLHNDSARHLLWLYQAHTYEGVFDLLPDDARRQPNKLLERVLEQSPDDSAAQRLLFVGCLNLLDFSQHELPAGLRIDESVSRDIIARCEALLARSPSLMELRSDYGRSCRHYRDVFHAWQAYQQAGIGTDFFEWFKTDWPEMT